jgi:5-methylcytosine-specific restriction endonuclease McrA
MSALKLLKPRLAALNTSRVQSMQPIAPDGTGWRAGKGGANARGYTYEWQKERERFLKEHPLCQCPDCDEGRIRLRPANVVDHKVPHRGDEALFWDESNWQAMNEDCHRKKTAGGA